MKGRYRRGKVTVRTRKREQKDTAVKDEEIQLKEINKGLPDIKFER
jgi:hypothetical protein